MYLTFWSLHNSDASIYILYYIIVLVTLQPKMCNKKIAIKNEQACPNFWLIVYLTLQFVWTSSFLGFHRMVYSDAIDLFSLDKLLQITFNRNQSIYIVTWFCELFWNQQSPETFSSLIEIVSKAKCIFRFNCKYLFIWPFLCILTLF